MVITELQKVKLPSGPSTLLPTFSVSSAFWEHLYLFHPMSLFSPPLTEPVYPRRAVPAPREPPKRLLAPRVTGLAVAARLTLHTQPREPL